jgi:hypothetical protein
MPEHLKPGLPGSPASKVAGPTVFLLVAGLLAPAVAAAAPTRPNVVLIMADDMGRPPYAGELSPNTVGRNWRQSTARGPGRGSAK